MRSVTTENSALIRSCLCVGLMGIVSPSVVLAHPQHGESVISWIHQLTEPDHLAWLLLPFLFVALMYWHLYRGRAQRSQREPVARRLSDSPNQTNPPR